MLVKGVPGAQAGIVQEKQVNIMAADALARCVARSSADMALTVQDKELLVSCEEGFQPTTSSQCREIICANIYANIFFCFQNEIYHIKGLIFQQEQAQVISILLQTW